MNTTQSDLDSRLVPIDAGHLPQVSKLCHALQATEASSPPPWVLPPAMPTDSRGWPAVCESDIDELMRGAFTPAALTLIRFKTDSVLAGAACHSVTSAADDIRNEVLELMMQESGRNLLRKAYGEPQQRLEWTVWALTRQQSRHWRRRLYHSKSNPASAMPLVGPEGEDIPVPGRSSEHRTPDVIALEKERAALLDGVAQQIARQPDGQKLANLLTWLRAGRSWNAIASSLQMNYPQVCELLDELKHRMVLILHELDPKDEVLAEKTAELSHAGWQHASSAAPPAAAIFLGLLIGLLAAPITGIESPV